LANAFFSTLLFIYTGLFTLPQKKTNTNRCGLIFDRVVKKIKGGRFLGHECPVSKLHDCGLQRLYSADGVAVSWLEGTAIEALQK